MIREALIKAARGAHLTADEAYQAFHEIMGGEVESPAVMAAFLTALTMNGPTGHEIIGAVRAMRAAGVKLHAPAGAVDIVGTGGDGFGTFNVSTTAAFIAAGAGAVVAKHGNRASTSKSGSADCLAALGYDLALPVDQVEHTIWEIGIGFCFANSCHPAMRFAAPVRRALPFRTIFNLLGPLANPAGVTHHALGVYAPEIVPLYIDALRALGAVHALVFCGPDGLDELGLAGVSHVAELRADGTVREYDFDPQRVFGAYSPMAELAGGTPAENAVRTRDVLAGRDRGACRRAAALNAAAALVAADRAATLEEGLARAEAALDSGRAAAKLDALIAACSVPAPV